MKSGMWLSQRQVRWLIVLLALLPLIPSALLVQVMLQNAMRDRDSAVTEITDVYRGQISLLVERFTKESETATGAELVEYLQRIFVDDVSLVVLDWKGSAVSGDPSQLSRDAIVYVISSGKLAGWTIYLDQVEKFPGYFNEQRAQTFWHVVFIVFGVLVVAGVVWFAVHRRLRVDEIRSDLLTTISHEIKTPVAAMKILIESLGDARVDSGTKEDYLHLLAGENRRIEELTAQFLTYGRLERGQIPIRRVDCGLREFLETELALVRPLFESAGGELHCHCPEDLTAYVDVAAMRVVLANLLENALKYGGEKPVVRVGAKAKGRRVELSVHDSGSGIPQNERKAVFRKFYQSDACLNRGKAGVGLGLAICRRFVKLLNGSIEVEPCEGSVGTRMTLNLPAANPIR